MSRPKSSLPTHPKKMARWDSFGTAGKWPDKLPRLSEFLMWVAGQKLGQQFAHSADSYCHKTPLIPEAFRDWTR